MTEPDRGAPRVLVVDDEPAVAQVISLLLRRAGFTVVTAGSGQDAMHLLDDPFDAMVLDLRLPGMRGDAFYYAASARQPWLASRALFLTGDITEQAEEVIAQTGCRFMRKPFDMHAMIDAVRAMIPLRESPRIPRVS